MGTKDNPYCCVSSGHIIHHCMHRSVEEELRKAKKRLDALSPESKQRFKNLIEDILNGQNN